MCLIRVHYRRLPYTYRVKKCHERNTAVEKQHRDMIPGYSTEELEVLRQTIVALNRLGEEDIRAATGAVVTGQCPPHLSPFWRLASKCPPLFAKLSADPLASTYSLYSFFPGVYERIHSEGSRPQIDFEGRTRGTVAILKFETEVSLVIKPLQGGREGEIAQFAGVAGVGPCQLPSLEGYLVEEFVSGAFFTDLPVEAMAESLLYGIGKRLGKMLAKLHARQIYYNDATLSDPEGRSHLIVQDDLGAESSSGPACKLIDFGVSVLLDDYPNLGLEDVYNLVRTTPEFRLLTRMGMREGEMSRFLAQYRQTLASISREEILARDLRFFHEGLQQAAGLFGPWISPPLREGFQAGYG